MHHHTSLHQGASLPRLVAAYMRVRGATPLLQLRAATVGSLRDRRITFISDDERLEVPTNRGSYSGHLYRVSGNSNPGAVIVHGSYPPGSGLPRYRLLGSRLAHRGITSLAVNYLGFGQSRLPAGPGQIEDYSAADALGNAMEFLGHHPSVDRGHWAICEQRQMHSREGIRPDTGVDPSTRSHPHGAIVR